MTDRSEWPDIDELERQEKELVLPAFDEEIAYNLGSAIADAARAISAPVVINIRTPERTLFHAALAGSIPDNEHWVRRKGNIVFRYLRSSLGVGVAMAAAGEAVGIERGLDPMEFAAHGGGFPIRVPNAGIVAAIGVSGLPQLDDHTLIVNSLRRFITEELA